MSGFLNLAINIALPAIILLRFSGAEYLGPVYGLIVALSFPLGYGLTEIIRQRKVNAVSVIGLVSILLTGSMGLLELDPKWIAIKEAAVPLVIGMFIVGSQKTKYPLVDVLLKQIIDIQSVTAALKKYETTQRYDERVRFATYLIGISFLVSSTLNYILAKILLVSPPGTEAFNAELGRMTALSYPVIALPSTIIMVVALLILVRDIEKLTHLSFEEIIIRQKK